MNPHVENSAAAEVVADTRTSAHPSHHEESSDTPRIVAVTRNSEYNRHHCSRGRNHLDRNHPNDGLVSRQNSIRVQ